jgi:hypothetical protein
MMEGAILAIKKIIPIGADVIKTIMLTLIKALNIVPYKP